MLDVVDGRRQYPLERRDDAAGSAHRPEDPCTSRWCDDRNSNFGENVYRRANCRQAARDKNEQGENHKRIWQPQCDPDQCCHEVPPTTGSKLWPADARDLNSRPWQVPLLCPPRRTSDEIARTVSDQPAPRPPAPDFLLFAGQCLGGAGVEPARNEGPRSICPIVC